MLRSLALVAALATVGGAQPSSTVLERSIKLYDRKDYYSASIELRKAIDGETGDTETKQRAQFFLGKTLYQLGYYAAAVAELAQIAAQGSAHRYYSATQKWLAALVATMPEAATRAIASYKLEEVDDPSLASVRGDLLYRRGLAHLRDNQFELAAKELAMIPRDDKAWSDAQVGRGLALLVLGRDADALAVLDAADTDLANLVAGQIHVRANAWDKAIAALAKVKGPLAPRAQWEASWARLARAGKTTAFEKLGPAFTTPIAEPAGTETAVLPALLAIDCPKPGRDGLVAFRRDAKKLHAELAAVTQSEDNAEFFHEHGRALRAGSEKALSPRGRSLVRAMLAGPRVAETLDLVDELDKELAMLSKADKAWQTTRVAAEILQELIVMQSVAESEAGHVIRDRIVRLTAALDGLVAAPPIPVGPDGFTVVCNAT